MFLLYWAAAHTPHQRRMSRRSPSGLELSLWLVKREFGVDAAMGVESMLEYEARGTVWQAPSSE
ncbi:hypothetical protein ACFXKS_11995 [Streptomyces scopuliridis]|uniref:hypothetical protein n=1 Tax=Streptomyces scopuliridis TaxID=452529 RepID=UPI0036C06D0A